MALIKKFTPQNSDKFLGKDQGDHSIAKFGHLNYMLRELNSALLSFTPGSILFADPSGDPAGDPTQFYWDNTNNRLGIGTNAPAQTLDVNGTARIQGNLTTNLTLGSVPFIGAGGLLTQSNANLFWDNSNVRLGIGLNTPTSALHVIGGENVAAPLGALPSGYVDGTLKLPQLLIESVDRSAPSSRYSIRAGGWHTSTWFGFDSCTSWTNPGGSSSIQNAAFGFRSMYLATTANNCSAFGAFALNSLTIGVENSAFGRDALGKLVDGSYNAAHGLVALYDVTSGSYNTAIGNRTGRGITTGSSNTIVGANVAGLATTLSNTVILADGAGTRRLYIDNVGNASFGSTTPSASAKLSVVSTTSGFLPPVMTGAQAEAIVSPAEGLMVYATSAGSGAITAKGWWGYNGSTWIQLG